MTDRLDRSDDNFIGCRRPLTRHSNFTPFETSERAISTTNRCSYFSSLVAKSTSSICPLSQGLLMSANCGVSSRQQLSFAAAIATWLYLDKRLLPEFQHVLPNVRWDSRVTPQQRQRKLRKIDAHNDSEIARWRNSCSITTYYLQNSFIQASHALTDCMNNVTTRHELLTLLRTLMQRETSTKYVVDHSYEREAMRCHWNSIDSWADVRSAQRSHTHSHTHTDIQNQVQYFSFYTTTPQAFFLESSTCWDVRVSTSRK